MNNNLSFSQFYEDVHDAWFKMGETCVDVSKCHITAEDGIRKIRGLLKPLDRYLTSTSSFAPSADVRPVIKGKWEHMWGDEWCCSQCGNVISTEGSWEHPLSDECKMYYCNVCGADMRQIGGDTE